MTRGKVLSQAIDQCLKEIYTKVQPSVEWEDFLEQNKKYIEKEKEYFDIPKEERPSYKEYMGPKPYEFYYLPKEIMKDIYDSYVEAYKIDNHQELLNIIEILKNYCNGPIVDKYIEEHTDEHGNHHPGYRGYDHPDNLKKEIIRIITEYDDTDPMKESDDIVNKFFEFLDMAGNFYDWNGELNTFGCSVYLGPSPNSNKQAVIDNWKEYRNKEIEINDDEFDEEQDYD